MQAFEVDRRRCLTLSTWILAAVALISLGIGCTTRTETGRDLTRASLKDFGKSLDTFDDRVSASVRAIDRLESPKTYDYQRAYMDFMSEYFNVIADAASVKERAEVMRDTGVDYFLVARKEVDAGNDAAAKNELTRREAVTKDAYQALQARLGDLDKQYGTYRSQLNGIYKFLNRNDTPLRLRRHDRRPEFRRDERLPRMDGRSIPRPAAGRTDRRPPARQPA
jgi:hypothetical protein